MVKRHVPLSRRIAINGGPLFGAFVWCAAVLTCAVLYPLRSVPNGGVAMAVVREAQVRVPESGRLTDLRVAAGDRVKAGDVVAIVEVPGLSQRITAAEALLSALRTSAEFSSVDTARKFAKDADASRARWLSAQVDLEAARAQLAGLDLELNRLSAPGIEVPRGQVEQLQAQKVAIQKEIVAREAEVAALRSATGSAESRAGSAAMSTLDADLVIANAELDELKAREAALRITAPASGIVGQDLRVVGEWVVAGEVMGRISAGEVNQAVVYVAAATARSLTPGSSASLLGSGGEEVEATIQSIGGIVESVPVRVQPDPAVPSWGVPVTLTVKNRPLIPGESLAVRF